jgi:hypothetical protein
MKHCPISLTESAGALIGVVSVPLLMQHEDGGHQAAASLTPAGTGVVSCHCESDGSAV